MEDIAQLMYALVDSSVYIGDNMFLWKLLFDNLGETQTAYC